MMELMHQLLLGNGILIVAAFMSVQNYLNHFYRGMNSIWIPLIGAILGVRWD